MLRSTVALWDLPPEQNDGFSSSVPSPGKNMNNMEITMYTRNPEVPQTQASLAQMSLAQRAEQAVLQVQ